MQIIRYLLIAQNIRPIRISVTFGDSLFGENCACNFSAFGEMAGFRFKNTNIIK